MNELLLRFPSKHLNKESCTKRKLKIGILKFLAYNIYSCEEVLFHFIVGTSDTKYTVVQAAELHIKRMVGAVDLNEPVIVKRFFDIFLGSAVLKVGCVITTRFSIS